MKEDDGAGVLPAIEIQHVCTTPTCKKNREFC